MPERHLDPNRYDFEADQAGLRAAAEHDLGEPLELARIATGFLADAVWQSAIPRPASDPPDAAFLRRTAIFGLAVLGVRTGRALILLVENGWEAEAHALKRRLTETVLRARLVLEDASGEAARQWHDGRAAGVGKLVARYAAERPWGIFSSGVHADARSLRLTMTPPPWIDVPDDQRAVQVTPLRNPRHAHGLLLECAWEANLLLVGLGEALGGGVRMGNGYMDRIGAARERFETSWPPRAT